MLSTQPDLWGALCPLAFFWQSGLPCLWAIRLALSTTHAGPNVVNIACHELVPWCCISDMLVYTCWLQCRLHCTSLASPTVLHCLACRLICCCRLSTLHVIGQSHGVALTCLQTHMLLQVNPMYEVQPLPSTRNVTSESPSILNCTPLPNPVSSQELAPATTTSNVVKGSHCASQPFVTYDKSLVNPQVQHNQHVFVAYVLLCLCFVCCSVRSFWHHACCSCCDFKL